MPKWSHLKKNERMPTSALKSCVAEWTTRNQMDGNTYLYIRLHGGAIMFEKATAEALVKVIAETFPELCSENNRDPRAN
jgi:hypothetical protein